MNSIVGRHHARAVRLASTRVVILSLLLGLSACGKPSASNTGDASRAQLNIGYSLLYQEANGIPKLQWLILFKDKNEELGDSVHDLVGQYEQLAGALEKLSKDFPALRIDVSPMSEIEADTRKALGLDQAKDFMPLTGKTGKDFERELLLMLYNALDEQRHLVGQLSERETEPALKAFLVKTRGQLEARRLKVEGLLNRRYFTH